MPTRPATAPDAAPTTEGLLSRIHDIATHPSMPAAAARVGDDECIYRVAVCSECRTPVEAEPPEPEQPCPEHDHRDVVRLHGLRPESQPLAEDQSGSQGCDAGADVDHVAAREVECAKFADPSTSPHPVSDGSVHDGHPQNDEQYVGAELHSLGERAGDKGRRDDCEHALEYHECLVRHVVSVWAGFSRADAAETQVGEVPDQFAQIRSERESVAPQHPDHSDDAHAHQAVHDCRSCVLAARQSAVEERESWGHE